MLVSQTTTDEHPPTPPPCRWPALISLPTLAKVHLVWRRLCELCCSLSPASSNTPLRPSVCHPSISLVVNIMFIRIFCEHLNVLYVFYPTCIVLKSGWSSTACLVVSPPSLSHSIPPPPPPSRLPDLITLPPLTKFQRVWRRLCEALLSSSFLAPQKHPYLLSRSCLNVRDIKVVLP